MEKNNHNTYDENCREYCEPLRRVCLNDGENKEHCEEKFEQCVSFCNFA